jgi:hypothetical protein
MELVIIIVVLGILAAVVIFALGGITDNPSAALKIQAKVKSEISATSGEVGKTILTLTPKHTIANLSVIVKIESSNKVAFSEISNSFRPGEIAQSESSDTTSVTYHFVEVPGTTITPESAGDALGALFFATHKASVTWSATWTAFGGTVVSSGTLSYRPAK